MNQTAIPRRAALGMLAAGLAAPALAQTVRGNARYMIGFPPGGSSDIVARAFTEKLRGSFATQIVVDNRPGAGGRLALDNLKASPPDGTVLCQTPASMLTIYPHLYQRTLRYQAEDFIPVTTVCAFPFGFTVRADHPARTLAEFIAWAKSRPTGIDWASPVPGSMPHFIGVEFARLAGFQATHVPYRGGAPVMQDVLSGTLVAGMNVISEPTPFHLGGQMRILAVTAPQRLPRLPNVPTFAESGFPQLTNEEWFGVLLPGGTPAPIVTALYEAIVAAGATAEVRDVLQRLETPVLTMPPAEFAARIRREREHWGPIVAASGFRPDE